MIALYVAASLWNVVDASSRSDITTWNPSPPPPPGANATTASVPGLPGRGLPAPCAGVGLGVEYDPVHARAAQDRLDVPQRDRDPGLPRAERRHQPLDRRENRQSPAGAR